MATVALVIVGSILGLGWNFGSSAPSQPLVQAGALSGPSTVIDTTPVSNETVKATSDETYRKLVLGRWETNRDGRRVLTVSEDGTAVMTVEVTGTWSYVLGDQITLYLNWQIEEGSLKFQTTGGKPAASVNVLTSLYGKERDQPIITLDRTTLRVPDDEPGDPDHVWTRL